MASPQRPSSWRDTPAGPSGAPISAPSSSLYDVLKPIHANTPAIAAALYPLRVRSNTEMAVMRVLSKWTSKVQCAQSDDDLHTVMLVLLQQCSNFDEQQLWCELFAFIMRANSASFIDGVTMDPKKRVIVFLVSLCKTALNNQTWRLALASGRALLNYVMAATAIARLKRGNTAGANQFLQNFLALVANRDIMTLWSEVVAALFLTDKSTTYTSLCHVFLVFVNVPYATIKCTATMTGSSQYLADLFEDKEIDLLKKVIASGKDSRLVAAAQQLLSVLAYGSYKVRCIVDTTNNLDLAMSALAGQERFLHELELNDQNKDHVETADSLDSDVGFAEIGYDQLIDWESNCFSDIGVSSPSPPPPPPPTSVVPERVKMFIPKLPLLQSLPVANSYHSVLSFLHFMECMLYIHDPSDHRDQHPHQATASGELPRDECPFRQEYIRKDGVRLPLKILSFISRLSWSGTDLSVSLSFEIVRSCLQSIANLAYTNTGAKAIVKHPDAISIIVRTVSFLMNASKGDSVFLKAFVPGIISLGNICYQLPSYKKIVSNLDGVSIACKCICLHNLKGSQLSQMVLSVYVLTSQLEMVTDGPDVASVLDCVRHFYVVAVQPKAKHQVKRVIVSPEHLPPKSDIVAMQDAKTTYGLLNNIVRYVLTFKAIWINQVVDLLQTMSPEAINWLHDLPTCLHIAPELFGDTLSEKLFGAVIDNLYCGPASSVDNNDDTKSSSAPELLLPQENLHVLELCHVGISPRQARAFIRRAIPLNLLGTRDTIDCGMALLADFCEDQHISKFVTPLKVDLLEEVLNPIAIAALVTASKSPMFEAVGLQFAFFLQASDRCEYWSNTKEQFFQPNLERNTWMPLQSPSSPRWSFDSNQLAKNTNAFDPVNPKAITDLCERAGVTMPWDEALLYHATTVKRAKSVMRKIRLTQYEKNLDFSMSPAFYLNTSLKDAIDWMDTFHSRSGALVIYKKPDLVAFNQSQLRDFAAPTVDQNGQVDYESWAEYAYWREHVSICRNEESDDEPDANLRLIIGPQAIVHPNIKPRLMSTSASSQSAVVLQWCVRHKDTAVAFDGLLVGLVSFRGESAS